jgi:hypothetical protein
MEAGDCCRVKGVAEIEISVFSGDNHYLSLQEGDESTIS